MARVVLYLCLTLVHLTMSAKVSHPKEDNAIRKTDCAGSYFGECSLDFSSKNTKKLIEAKRCYLYKNDDCRLRAIKILQKKNDEEFLEALGRMEGDGRFLPLQMGTDCVEMADECPNGNISFWLYTRAIQDNPIEIRPDNLNQLPYNRDHPWVFILHGYTGDRDYSPNQEIRPAYFEHGDYNIISIDYGPLVRETCYISAASNVPIVGRCTAQFLDHLVRHGVIHLQELHVVAFSLGAQVAGFAGQYVESGRLRRITGLDPAWPLFMSPDGTTKLDAADADFVDVIHTAILRKGQPVNTGHIDFYVNGGYNQPGCDDTSPYGSTSSCNHARAPIYFAESISSKIGFWGVPCSTYFQYYGGLCTDNSSVAVIMGAYTPTTSAGTYYLETHDKSPFAIGKPKSRRRREKKKKQKIEEEETLFWKVVRTWWSDICKIFTSN